MSHILLTGVSGYIGSALLPKLLEAGHEVTALVRKIPEKPLDPRVHLVIADLLDPASLEKIPEGVEIAYYLVHSMSDSKDNYTEMEQKSAETFAQKMTFLKVRQIIYLSGLVNEKGLSEHLQSRKNVKESLERFSTPVTTLMAGIIIGKESSSFQMMQDLVSRLPIMTAPRWIENQTQPIAIEDVLNYLLCVLNHRECFRKSFEIGGREVLSYKELLYLVAELMGKKRWIIPLPVLTPKLSSYWLYFVTRVPFYLAASLVESLKNHAICKEHSIEALFPKKLCSLREAIKKALIWVCCVTP